MNLYIIIPVHNRIQLTKQCLEALYSQSSNNFRLVIIDDGSTDGTNDFINFYYPEAHIITGDGNWWWTKCINTGIQYALNNKADWILTLNNDTVPEIGYLERLHLTARNYPDVIIGSAGVNELGEIIYAGVNINWITAYTEKVAKRDLSKEPEIIPVNQFAGRGLLIPVSLIRTLGPFDERMFPHYGADMDFTIRATREGFKVICDTRARLRIFPELSGDYEIRSKKDLSNYYFHLFGKKGGGNLCRFLKFAFKNCPPHYLPLYLIAGILRRFLGFWK